MKSNFTRALGWFCLSATMASGAEPGAPSIRSELDRAALKREAVRLDAQFLDGVTNRAQWEAHRMQRRQDYLEMLGLWPMPARTPLQAQVTGVLERKEGFRVENLHFQSRPGLYVTGNLYLPRGAKAGAKLPAILYVCGHSGRGRDGNKTAFQQHGMWFATHGYACLVIDTLQLGEIGATHHGTYRENRWWWQARGYTPAGVECWNGMRAIDYLLSRPEVDPDRIGVTGISGGGAATFWIAAADERVKVAVPVSGMSDLEDYVGEKIVNGHCDCMFLINTFQWPWTQIAALIPPRPMLFENSGHDTIFPMNGNDRIRARLERLYGFYTNRTDRVFDIGVVPGGHEDKVELRLMAYRWMNRFLKNEDAPVTEPELPPFEGRMLRAFPDALPTDQINTRIDELFVPMARDEIPDDLEAFQRWQTQRMADLRRLVFRSVPQTHESTALRLDAKAPHTGTTISEPGVSVSWKYFPAGKAGAGDRRWLVVLEDEDSLDVKPAWLPKNVGDASLLLIAPRGLRAPDSEDPPPYYIRRALPLLGRTVDTGKVIDALAVARGVVYSEPDVHWSIVGRRTAGVIGAYAALFEPRLEGVSVIEPPASHKLSPIFLNVLRVVDVPEALALLAPRSLEIITGAPADFVRTKSFYRVAGGNLSVVSSDPR